MKTINTSKIDKIITLTLQKTNMTRREIAKEVGVSKQTVWKYQKCYDLI